MTPWWKFWHPESGLVGGLIVALVIGAAFFVIFNLIRIL